MGGRRSGTRREIVLLIVIFRADMVDEMHLTTFFIRRVECPVAEGTFVGLLCIVRS